MSSSVQIRSNQQIVSIHAERIAGNVLTPTIDDSVKERFDNALKRGFDVSISLIVLGALLPLMAFVAAAIRLTTKENAIFSQKRLTDGGRVFTMYKFRTMRSDAEAETGAVMAEENDSRVTRIGKILRRSRIDELPQLLNVIIGDMSLIGPRPERPEIFEKIAAELPGLSRRLGVRGGITGLAQIRVGYASCIESYRDKLAWDLAYIENRSFALDMKIAWETISVLFTGFGAR